MNRFLVAAIKVLAILPILTLVLSGCANFGTDRPPEEVVTQRAQGWMDALPA